MSEKQCPACKMMVHADAKICPHCRTKQGMGIWKTAGIVFFVLFAMGIVMNALKQDQPTQPQVKPISQQDEEKKQPGRKKLIQEGISRGIFYKVSYGGQNPEVWVDSVFYSLTFDDKQKMINVVYAYSKIQNPDSIVVVSIKNKMSGKEIGEYSESNGGLKMY